MTDMDAKLLEPCCVDRLSSLPDGLLSQILSVLPTKNAAAMQVLSKGMRQAFTLITSVDLDDSPVALSLDCPHRVELSAHFKSFINNILQKLSECGQPLTRFRLRLGGDKTKHLHVLEDRDNCSETVACFSDLKPDRLYEWISFPLSHYGLKDVDISFHVINPCDIELPSRIFTCRSVEVLKLDSNLKINNDEIPLICLPNLKLLHLRSFVFSDDEFVTRLVSSCPVLDELSITYCFWEILDHVTISSHSLRSLVLDIWKRDPNKQKNSNLVFIDTPSLQYLEYDDYLSARYSTVPMNSIVEADISMVTQFYHDTEKTCFRNQLSLIQALSNVQRLSLLGNCTQNVYFSRELEDELPMFPNLRILKLGSSFRVRWDIVLSLFLRRSPLLETLVFPKGLYGDDDSVFASPIHDDVKLTEEEAKAWSTNETIHSGCMSHLKKIALRSCYVRNREINMIKFFLREAPVLKGFVICMYRGFDPILLQDKLKGTVGFKNVHYLGLDSYLTIVNL